MATEINIFEQAVKTKLRFASPRGELTVEDLWELPLTSKSGMSLDAIGRPIMKTLRDSDEDSLVETASTSRNETNVLRLSIIKHIISAKQAENLAKTNQAALDSQRAILRQALASKRIEEVNNLSAEELERRIAAL